MSRILDTILPESIHVEGMLFVPQVLEYLLRGKLDRVVLILRKLAFTKPAVMEELFTGMTRTRSDLRIVDATPRHEIYNLLKSYNSCEVRIRCKGRVDYSCEPDESAVL